MGQCLAPHQMTQFLDTTGLRYTLNDLILTVHAAVGDVLWVFDGYAFCIGTGVGA